MSENIKSFAHKLPAYRERRSAFQPLSPNPAILNIGGPYPRDYTQPVIAANISSRSISTVGLTSHVYQYTEKDVEDLDKLPIGANIETHHCLTTFEKSKLNGCIIVLIMSTPQSGTKIRTHPGVC